MPFSTSEPPWGEHGCGDIQGARLILIAALYLQEGRWLAGEAVLHGPCAVGQSTRSSTASPGPPAKAEREAALALLERRPLRGASHGVTSRRMT